MLRSMIREQWSICSAVTLDVSIFVDRCGLLSLNVGSGLSKRRTRSTWLLSIE